MKTYIVLLRGINVGGKNLVPMKELVKVLEESFGMEPAVHVLEVSEFEAAVANNPFESPKGKGRSFTCLHQTALEDQNWWQIWKPFWVLLPRGEISIPSRNSVK